MLRDWKIIVGIFLIIRVLLLLISVGSDDMRTWEMFAETIKEVGLLNIYTHYDGSQRYLFNHPPLAGFLSLFLLELSALLQISFTTTFRLFQIFAELLLIKELFNYYREDKEKAVNIAWAVALLPCFFMFTAFHGNTDMLCAVLMILGLLFAERKRFLAAGMLIALSINIKIIPILLLPLCFFYLLQNRGLTNFSLAFALVNIPFLLFVYFCPQSLSNIFAYGSSIDLWGFRIIAMLLGLNELVGQNMLVVSHLLLPMLLTLIAFISVRSNRLSLLQIATLIFLVFIVLTPGFAIQYFTFPLALLIFSKINFRLLFIVLMIASIFVTSLYATFIPPALPLRSDHQIMSFFSALLGLLLWISFVFAQIVILRMNKRFA